MKGENRAGVRKEGYSHIKTPRDLGGAIEKLEKAHHKEGI